MSERLRRRFSAAEAKWIIEDAARRSMVQNLVIGKGFTEDGAKRAIQNFINSLKFAGLWDEFLARWLPAQEA